MRSHELSQTPAMKSAHKLQVDYLSLGSASILLWQLAHSSQQSHLEEGRSLGHLGTCPIVAMKFRSTEDQMQPILLRKSSRHGPRQFPCELVTSFAEINRRILVVAISEAKYRSLGDLLPRTSRGGASTPEKTNHQPAPCLSLHLLRG